MEIKRLALLGRSDLEIAGQLGCDVRTLRRYYQAELLEERQIRERFFEWGRLRFECAKNDFYVTRAQISRELDRALAGS